MVSIKKELEGFNHFPVVIKRIQGFHGDFVDKGDNTDEAIAVIKRFWEKGDDHFPILAQEFIDSPSYRVVTIDGEVVQTAIKKSYRLEGNRRIGYPILEVQNRPGTSKNTRKVKKNNRYCGLRH